MFDLIAENTERPFLKSAPAPRILSIALHVGIATFIVAIPLLTITSALPDAPSMMAFVADASAPTPPPPPPPPAARAASKPEPATPRPTPSANAFAAPVEAPSAVQPEAPGDATRSAAGGGVANGVEGGAVGGIDGGTVGGIVGGVVAAPLPPRPPAAPVRIGGQIKAPAILHRVEPQYPNIAANAHVSGLVVLEAAVDIRGGVQSIKVLRPGHPLLDREAMTALKQWRYTPLVLNGIPTPFVLTVTFNFHTA